MRRLLVVHHTTSPPTDSLFEAVMAGAADPSIDGVEVVARAALGATAADVLQADGYILGTPANLGYMSGALKHFFDTVYYTCLHDSRGRPYAAYVHGNNDTDGALASIEKAVTGLGWTRVRNPVVVIGTPSRADLDAVKDLGATVAARLSTGMV